MMRQVHEKPGPCSWSDFVALPEDDRRELIDGRLVEIEIPKRFHEWFVAYLLMHVGPWALAHGLYPLGSGYRVRINDKRGVMPDFQLLSEEAFVDPENEDGCVVGRPELAVEIISPTSRSYDRVTKLSWYAELGVPEYWIVDRDAKRIERYALKRGAYVLEQQVEGDDVFRPKAMRGLKIPLGPMWFGAKRKKR